MEDGFEQVETERTEVKIPCSVHSSNLLVFLLPFSCSKSNRDGCHGGSSSECPAFRLFKFRVVSRISRLNKTSPRSGGDHLMEGDRAPHSRQQAACGKAVAGYAQSKAAAPRGTQPLTNSKCRSSRRGLSDRTSRSNCKVPLAAKTRIVPPSRRAVKAAYSIAEAALRNQRSRWRPPESLRATPWP